MFKSMILFFIFLSFSYASSNTFFVIEDTMSLTCDDIIKVNEFRKKGLFVTYNKKGSEKLKNLTQDNIGKSMGLIIDNRVIFFNVKLRGKLGESVNNDILISTKSIEDLTLLKKSLTCK